MPRTAAQLRAAAVASGWFDGPTYNYAGDGYSVPWQTGLFLGPPVGFTLASWKRYLDGRVPEPARLHDWLYTPYGPRFLQCTQEEADDALLEEMRAGGLAEIQCQVVYQACRIGGEPYFGVSSVGYIPPPLQGAGSNIPPTLVGTGGEMALFKVVMVFQNTTSGMASSEPLGYTIVPRTGGWSESFYLSVSDVGGVMTFLKGGRGDAYPGIWPSRASLLPITARILGARVYESGGGRGQFVPGSYPGTWALGDVPSMALLCATTSPSTPTVRRFTMRGIPDNQVVGGEFAPTSQFATELRTYFDSLTNTSYPGRTIVPTQTIFSITAGGVLTATVPLTYLAGDIVKVRMSTDEDGFRRSGEFLISAVGPLGSQVTLSGWQFGATSGGTLSVPGTAQFPVSVGRTTAVRITNHKIGRPFAGYRGRNSRRSRR